MTGALKQPLRHGRHHGPKTRAVSNFSASVRVL